MDSDPSWVKLIVDAGQFLLTGIVGVYLHLELRDRARGHQVDRLRQEIDRRLDEMAGRLAAQEAKMGSLPTHGSCAVHLERLAAIEARAASAPGVSEFVRLHERMDDQLAQVNAIAGGLSRVESLIDTLHDHLLNRPFTIQKL
jgi:hypothetical protein